MVFGFKVVNNFFFKGQEIGRRENKYHFLDGLVPSEKSPGLIEMRRIHACPRFEGKRRSGRYHKRGDKRLPYVRD